VAPEELPRPIEHRGEIDGRKDEADRLFDDAAVRVFLRSVLRDDGEASVANHGTLSTQIPVSVATGNG
jgi:hypothetical protein